MNLRHSLLLSSACLIALLSAPRCLAQAQDDPFGKGNDESSVAEDAPSPEKITVFVAPITGKPIEASRSVKYDLLPGVKKPAVWESHEFRDAEGRTRVEMRTGSFPAWIYVTDPVAHKRYTWVEGRKQVTAVDLPATYRERKPEPPLPPDAPVIDGHPTSYRKLESRTTPGLVTEIWYSPDLMYTVKRVVHNPKIGTITYTWNHFKTGDPKPKLFEPPH